MPGSLQHSRDDAGHDSGLDAVKTENNGSIFRDFVAGKSSIAFQASVLIHLIHRAARYEPILLKSSIVNL